MPSHFPDDLFTSTEGQNYGLDGYPDLDYGAGVLDGQVLGEPKQPPTLPDGVVAFEDDGLDDGGGDAITFGGLGNISSVVREASIQDLSWLDLAEQDPERLPKNPVDTAIPELEEAWGVNRQTNGVTLTPNVDRIATVQSPKRASDADIGHLVRKAWRRVTNGEPFRTVATEVAARLGEDAPRAREAMAQILDDAGLIGRVFVRASAYPNCASGRWSEQVRKQASGARYIVAKTACGDCVHNQNGSCAIFRKEIVDEVPWKKALAKYRGQLDASGRRVAANLPPKEALRQAFAQDPRGLQAVESMRPVQPAPDAGVTSGAAKKALAEAPGGVAIVSPVTARDVAKQVASWRKAGLLSEQDMRQLIAAQETPGEVLRAATRLALSPRGEVRGRIESWRKAGMLSAADADRLAASAAPAREVMRVAVALASRAAPYSGDPNQGVEGAPITREAAWNILDQAEGAGARADGKLRNAVANRRLAAVQAKVAKVTDAIGKGLRGGPLRQLIRATIGSDDVAIAAPLLDPLLKKTGALADPKKVARAYEGPKFERAAAAQSVGVGPAHGEVRRLLRWARQVLTEGTAGMEFDQLLSARFASSVVDAGAEELRKLRARHEGLSGHAYVDARAYASEAGTNGCEKGGLKHRANAIPAVLQMSRCGSCSRRALREDGTAVCQVYNKPLVASAPVENPKAYQAEMIRLANGNDADRTAALFVNNYDPDEFGLGGGDSEFDNLVASDMPANEKLGEILFGGMELE